MKRLLPWTLLFAAIIGFLGFIGLWVSPTNWVGQLIGLLIAILIIVGILLLIARKNSRMSKLPSSPQSTQKPTPPDKLYESKE